MSEEIKELHIKTYDEWLKYYKNATKEQVIEDLTRDVQYFADAVKDIGDLQQKVEQLEKENEKLKYLVDDSNIIKAFIVEHNKVEQLENIRKEAIKIIKKQMPICIMPNNTLIHGAEKAKVLENLLNILNKGSE